MYIYFVFLSIISNFVRLFSPFNTSAPGQYIIKLATGKKWYGDRHLFGANASYSKIDKVITIPENTRYTIDLTPSLFGTLKEKKIGVNQW